MAKLISADLTNNKLCIIKYTTTNRKILGFFPNSFDAKILSNTYHINGEIIFEKPITKLCGLLSISNKDLTSILIPDSVESIDDRVFVGCTNLENFRGKFSSVDGRCLIQNGKLVSFARVGITDYTIPNSVTSIGNRAFSNCTNLISINIPNSVISIGEESFYGCTSLTNISISNNISVP